MGVPAFYRWLSKKFCRCVTDCIEEETPVFDGEPVPIDTSQPNPNGTEYDCLYLDMNGIIHPCCHPEDKPAPETEDEMISEIFKYVDRIFNIVRPRKVLYLAIDGVAPRAKMNQQRSRRFRSAKEMAEKELLEKELRKEWEKDNSLPVPPEKREIWDSNVITPGTPFMDKVARGLRYYLCDRIQNDPGFRNIQVIFSDASAPGEGEHKIMEYIRKQRNQPEYNPNLKHVVYGLDADLIMLALATHELNFTLIRELVTFGFDASCYICGQKGHLARDCEGKSAIAEDTPLRPFQFLHTSVLREYLAHEFIIPYPLPFSYNFERVVDDFIFICFLVGNDFIPHLPTLEIREGALDTLIQMYKRILPTLGGYLTENGDINVPRTIQLLQLIADQEEQILSKRRSLHLKREARAKHRELQQKQQQDEEIYHSKSSLTASKSVERVSNIEAAQFLKTKIHEQQGEKKEFKENRISTATEIKKEEQEHEKEKETDRIRLGEAGWKVRYYEVKFNKTLENNDTFFTNLCESYLEGMCWVMKYYYQGCVSWGWYYPYNYSPFATDLTRYIDPKKFRPNFSLGTPFRPLDQLMAVLPPSSRHCLPKSYQKLMIEKTSEIFSWYPEDFDVDMDGKKYLWQAIVILPWIDADLLLRVLAKFEHTLTLEEQQRNAQSGPDILFVHKNNSLNELICQKKKSNENDTWEITQFTPLFGFCKDLHQENLLPVEKNSELSSPISSFPALSLLYVRYYEYLNPKYPEDFVFPSRVLSGSIYPPPTIDQRELELSALRTFWGMPGRVNGVNPSYYRHQNLADNRRSNLPEIMYGQDTEKLPKHSSSSFQNPYINYSNSYSQPSTPHDYRSDHSYKKSESGNSMYSRSSHDHRRYNHPPPSQNDYYRRNNHPPPSQNDYYRRNNHPPPSQNDYYRRNSNPSSDRGYGQSSYHSPSQSHSSSTFRQNQAYSSYQNSTPRYQRENGSPSSYQYQRNDTNTNYYRQDSSSTGEYRRQSNYSPPQKAHTSYQNHDPRYSYISPPSQQSRDISYLSSNQKVKYVEETTPPSQNIIKYITEEKNNNQ